MPESEQPTQDDSGLELQRLLNEASEEFCTECLNRMVEGGDKYGPYKFLSVDTLKEAMAEVVDLSNYAHMTYVKLWMIQRTIHDIVSKHPTADAVGFVSLKEMMGHD